MTYKIKYDYDSGDSFNQYPNNEGFVEIEWKTIEKAEENLKRIQEHYKMYQEMEKYNSSKRTNEEIFADNTNKDWFVNISKLVSYDKDNPDRVWGIDEKDKEKQEKAGFKTKYIPDYTQAQNCIILYTDDNEPFQFWCPWCGYFERLNSVEIVTNSLKIQF